MISMIIAADCLFLAARNRHTPSSQKASREQFAHTLHQSKITLLEGVVASACGLEQHITLEVKPPEGRHGIAEDEPTKP